MIDYYEDKRWRKKPKYGKIAIVLLLWIIALIIIGHNYSSKEKIKIKTISSHSENVIAPEKHSRWLKLTEYFRLKGNKYPKMMATAVLETKKPKLMAAIAVKGEKNTPYTVRRGGYKKRHVGAWQVNERDWGKVGHTTIDQALKSEKILDELIAASNGSVSVALNKYGGDKTKKVYAKNILDEIENIP